MLIILNVFITPYASKGYSFEETSDVIRSLLSVSWKPYAWVAPVFHVATLLLIIAIWILGDRMSRIFDVYFGVNYLFIAFTQVMGFTEEYGFVVMVGSVISYCLIGLLFFWDAFKTRLSTQFGGVSPIRYWVIPLAFIAFWSPFDIIGMKLDFNPILLLTSVGYGLSFCMTTPVVLGLLTLFYPRVNEPVLKVTSFVGIIYGLLNMGQLADPTRFWLGVLHFPLLLISIYAFLTPYNMEDSRGII